MADQIDEERQRLEFVHMIMATLEANPAWLHDALNAISMGINNALQNARARSAEYDLAFRCALSLTDPKRLNQSTKDLLNQKISEVISSNATCKVEEEFLERVKCGQFQPAGKPATEKVDG